VWNKAASRQNAISGFTSTGIYPLNQHAISDSAFRPAEVSERALEAPSQSPDRDQPADFQENYPELSLEMDVKTVCETGTDQPVPESSEKCDSDNNCDLNW